MIELDLTLVRAHLKADAIDAEDDLLTQYVESAVSICEDYCNRNFYEDDAELDAAWLEGIGDLEAAEATYAEIASDDDFSDTAKAAARDRYIERQGTACRKVNGKVATPTVRAAILMTVGHLYKNRQSVVVGQMNATEVPQSARRILEPYLWIGDLAGS